MRLGVYFDLRNPEGWRRPWADHYAQSLEWVEGADAAGADGLWVTEHHFFEDGYLTQPLTFAAAMAARSRRARIGTAVVLAPMHPVLRIAEDAALVDLISGGRLELGLGAGYVRSEFEAFGADRSRRFDTTDARIRELGEIFRAGDLRPPPLQQPIPLWAGYMGRKGARRAGRLGVGLLSLSRDLAAPYLSGLEEAGHSVDLARMGGLLRIVCADDPERAFPEIVPHIAHQQNSYTRAMYAGSGKRAPEISEARILEAGRRGQRVAFQVLDVREAAEFILASTAGLPVEHAYLWASVAGMPDALVERHIELSCGLLRDALRDGAEAPAAP